MKLAFQILIGAIPQARYAERGKMRVLWICNIMLPVIARDLGRECSNKEGWLAGLMDTLLTESPQVELGVAFPVSPGEEMIRGETLGVHYYGFRENTGKPEIYDPGLERDMEEILRDFQPQLLHCFGTEYPHTLAAVRSYGRPENTLVGIQGLCAVYADAYMANTPREIWHTVTFRDWLKRDSLLRQQEKFRRRGQWEQEAVRLTGHVAGRTDWDRHWTTEWNPGARYHLLRETLRPCFYQGEWSYENCRRHSIFMSQGDYPIKGLHYMLDAMPAVLEQYPDAHLYVAGNCLLRKGPAAWFKISAYGKYLERQIREYGLAEHVTFLGSRTGEQMKEQYLGCNVYVCVSSIENSPNSLGEAMLLGVPVVAGEVGGIGSMITPDEGWLFPGYQGEDSGEGERISKALGRNVLEVFAQGKQVAERTKKARIHAGCTHDGAANLKQLMELYEELS